MPRINFLLVALLAIAPLPMLACGGGGGGGGSFIGAAIVTIGVSPGNIDRGDRTQVRIDVEQPHPDGILLKVRYPSDLTFVPNSANLTVNGDDTRITPAINQSSGNDVYLVFFLSNEQFGEDERGYIELELEAIESNKDAQIEVDADVDDPLIDNPGEFSIDNPEFEAEDADRIEISG